MPLGGLGTAALIGGGIKLVGGIIKGIEAGKQKKEANQVLNQANQLGAFNEQIPGEVTELAGQGLPAQQYQQAMNNIQQQQLQAINSSQNRRAGIGAIGGIQSATNNATLGLDAKNAAARQQNMLNLASWKDKTWQNNVKARYNQQYNYGMGLLGASNVNKFNAIDSATAGVAQGLNGSGLLGSSYNPSGSSNLNYATQNTGSVGGPQGIGPQSLGYQTNLSGGGLFGG